MSFYGSCQPSDGQLPLVVTLAGCHQGQTKLGVDFGWAALVGDERLSEASFIDFRNPAKFDDPIRGCTILSRNIIQGVEYAKLKSGQSDISMLLLGGDHTASIGSVMASRNINPATRLVWIDAHPDINTPWTTLSVSEN